MKKLICTILTISIFFSIANVNAANEGYMDRILDLAYGIEEYKLKLNELDYVYFYDKNSQTLYDEFRATDNILKDEILRLYKNGTIDYYTTNGVIDEYNLFLYHTNKMFFYISMKQSRYENQLDSIILKHYELSKSHYERTKFLLTPKPKKPEDDWCPIAGLRPCIINLKYY